MTAAAWSWGDRAFWIDEALNDMLALSDRHVAAVGHARIFVWDRRDGALVRTFNKFLRPEQAWFAGEGLCLRARGRVVVCGLASGAIEERDGTDEDPRLPEVTTDRAAYTVTVRWADGRTLVFAYPNESIRRVSFGGGRIAIGLGSRIEVRDARDGAVVHTLRGAGNGVLAPDGRWIAVGDLADSRVFVGEVDAWAPPVREGPNGRVVLLRCDPAGARVLVVAGGSGFVLRVADGATIVRLAAAGLDEHATWTADGAAILGPAGERVVRCDAATGAVTQEFSVGGRTRTWAFAVDARGSRVATIGHTYPGGLMLVPAEEAVVWDVARGAEVARVRLEDVYDEALALAPDGGRLAMIHAEGVRVVTLPDAGGEVAIERVEGAWFGFAGDEVRLAELSDGTGKVVRVRGGVVDGEMTVTEICGFAATPDGRWFALARHDGSIVVHRGDDFAVRGVVQAPERATELALGGDGGIVIAGGWDATVHAYRVDELEGG